MNHNVRVHLLPELFEPPEMRGGVAVILDILRASTTIVHALANGARCVIPALDIPTAQSIAASYAENDVCLGGERDGLLIPGFHLDNNPFAYTTEAVGNKAVVFTTTNGTKALHRAKEADRILIGAFVNMQAVLNVLSRETRPIHFVCAGTRGKITAEDSLCAGAFATKLAALGDADPWVWTDDQLRLACGFYVDAAQSSETFLQAMSDSDGGQNCRRLGFESQIARAATSDLYNIVPEYDHDSGQISIAASDA